jgi:hypothetical protein
MLSYRTPLSFPTPIIIDAGYRKTCHEFGQCPRTYDGRKSTDDDRTHEGFIPYFRIRKLIYKVVCTYSNYLNFKQYLVSGSSSVFIITATIKTTCSNTLNFLVADQNVTYSYKWGAGTVATEPPCKSICRGDSPPQPPL